MNDVETQHVEVLRGAIDTDLWGLALQMIPKAHSHDVCCFCICDFFIVNYKMLYMGLTILTFQWFEHTIKTS